MKPVSGRLFEHRPEAFRRMADLRRVEPHPYDPPLVGEAPAQGLDGLICTQVPQEAHGQVGGHPEGLLAVFEGPPDTRDRGPKGHAPAGVGLRVEEDLGVARALEGGLPEAGEGQVVEVPLVKQHPGALVVEVQKGLQIGEIVDLEDLEARESEREELHSELVPAMDIRGHDVAPV
jgi:hypothetical protein